MSQLTLDAESLARLLAGLTPLSRVAIADGRVEASAADGGLSVSTGDLAGDIRVTVGGMPFRITALAVGAAEVRATFSVG